MKLAAVDRFLCGILCGLDLLTETIWVFEVKAVVSVIRGYRNIQSLIICKQLYIDSRELMIPIILRPGIVLVVILAGRS